MLFLKVMSGQDLPDEHPSKHYTIYQIPDSSAVSFGDGDSGMGLVRASWYDEGGLRTVHLEGNAYLMNAQGKTISAHGAY